MTHVMAHTIRALKRFLNRDIRDLFGARRSVGVSLSAETATALDHVMAGYSIEVALLDRPFCVRLGDGQRTAIIEGQAATSAQATWYIPLFAEEFGLYPPLLVRKTKLRRVVLCAELSRKRQRRPWVTGQPASLVHEPHGAILDLEHGVIYLDVTYERDDEEYMRKLIHHEFYHLVQRRQFGRSGDPGWAALNSPGFAYGPGGLAVKDDPTFWVTQMEEWGNGFLNRYSMSSPNEDQAEIFAHLLTEPARLKERLRTDDVLRMKVERLKSSLERFCRAVGAGFWQRVEESRWPYGL
jgi:hypothetical protein